MQGLTATTEGNFLGIEALLISCHFREPDSAGSHLIITVACQQIPQPDGAHPNLSYHQHTSLITSTPLVSSCTQHEDKVTFPSLSGFVQQHKNGPQTSSGFPDLCFRALRNSLNPWKRRFSLLPLEAQRALGSALPNLTFLHGIWVNL